MSYTLATCKKCCFCHSYADCPLIPRRHCSSKVQSRRGPLNAALVFVCGADVPCADKCVCVLCVCWCHFGVVYVCVSVPVGGASAMLCENSCCPLLSGRLAPVRLATPST